MLQTKGIETTTRELDFPCFLQNKYLFVTKAAGRMRHVPLTLKACMFVPAAVEVWLSTECYLRSGWVPSPPACELTSSATCTKQSPESPAGICSKWKAKWAMGLLLGVAPYTAPSKQHHHFLQSHCVAASCAGFWNELRRDNTGTKEQGPKPSRQLTAIIWISNSKRWLAKRRGNEGEFFGVQGGYLLLDAAFERIRASLSWAHSLNSPITTDLCFEQ